MIVMDAFPGKKAGGRGVWLPALPLLFCILRCASFHHFKLFAASICFTSCCVPLDTLENSNNYDFLCDEQTKSFTNFRLSFRA
mmetsp:Transcript_60441/g.148318  ORF Transcript_60441/g.148318 Transcript_60441/m.148318 type:complete len:83 (+) Transcript_60441:33-281(+)